MTWLYIFFQQRWWRQCLRLWRPLRSWWPWQSMQQPRWSSDAHNNLFWRHENMYITGFCDGNPTVLWCFFWRQSQQIAEQTVKRQVNWDVFTLIWRHCNAWYDEDRWVGGGGSFEATWFNACSFIKLVQLSHTAYLLLFVFKCIYTKIL